MKAQAEKLIAYLKRTKKVKIASSYVGKTIGREYYYTLSGWLQEKYFCIYFFKEEGSPSESLISSTTDCTHEIRNLFKKYSLDETRQ